MVICASANSHEILALCCTVDNCEGNVTSVYEKCRDSSIPDVRFQESH